MRYIIILLLLVFTSDLKSSDDLQWYSFGVFASGAVSQQAYDRNALLSLGCCPNSFDGSGIGGSYGLLLNFRLNTTLELQTTLGFRSSGADLISRQNPLININGKEMFAEIEHTHEFSLSTFEMGIGMGIELYDNLSLSVGMFFDFVTNAEYTKFEKLTAPSFGTFENRKRVRNESKGEEPNVENLLLSPYVGLSYRIPIVENKSLNVIPSIKFKYGITDIVPSKNWTSHTFDFSLGLEYRPLVKEEEIPEEEHTHVIEIKPPVIKKTIPDVAVVKQDEYREPQRSEETIVVAKQEVLKPIVEEKIDISIPEKEIHVGLEILGQKDQNQIKLNENRGIEITTLLVKESMPLVSSIFFKENSDQLIDLYKTDKYDAAATTPSMMDLNVNIISILAQRLGKQASASIVLTGYIDVHNESDCEIAYLRAQKIKTLLIDRGVAHNQISIVADTIDCAPDKSLITRSVNAFADNRRVDISSSDHTILAPFDIAPFSIVKESNVDQLICNVLVDGFGEEINIDWKMKHHNSMFLETNTTDYKVNDHGIICGINETNIHKLVDKYPLDVSIKVSDKLGNSKSLAARIKVSKDTLSFQLDKVNFCIFDINSDEVKGNNLRLLEQYFSKLSSEDRVIIRGYTDELGEEKYNQQLSRRRAESVVKILKKLNPSVSNISVKGEGVKEIKGNKNSIKRFLSRIVEIEIHRNMKKNNK